MDFQFKHVFCGGSDNGNHKVYLFEARNEIERLEKLVRGQKDEITRLNSDIKEMRENYGASQKMLNIAENNLVVLCADYAAVCERRDEIYKSVRALEESNEFWIDAHKLTDEKLEALKAEVLAFLTVTLMVARSQATIEDAEKVLARLHKLVIE